MGIFHLHMGPTSCKIWVTFWVWGTIPTCQMWALLIPPLWWFFCNLPHALRLVFEWWTPQRALYLLGATIPARRIKQIGWLPFNMVAHVVGLFGASHTLWIGPLVLGTSVRTWFGPNIIHPQYQSQIESYKINFFS